MGIDEMFIYLEREINEGCVVAINKGIEDNWLVDCLDVWDYTKWRNHNYLAVVTRNEKGENQYEWLKPSKNSDEYFFVADVKLGDILLAGCKKANKSYSNKAFYGVIAKTENAITLVRDTTYLKVKKILKGIADGTISVVDRPEYYTLHKKDQYHHFLGLVQINDPSKRITYAECSCDGENWAREKFLWLDTELTNIAVFEMPPDGDMLIRFVDGDENYVIPASVYYQQEKSVIWTQGEFSKICAHS